MKPSSRPAALAAVALAAVLATASCGEAADPQAPAGPAAVASADAGGVRVVDAPTAVELIASGGPLVIDVRTPEEFAAGHVEGARNIDVQSPDFSAQVAELDPQGGYVLYCRTGNRSAAAASILREMGFTDVADAGAFDALVAAGAPTA